MNPVKQNSDPKITELRSQSHNSKKNFRGFSDNAWKNHDNYGFPFVNYLNNNNNKDDIQKNNYNMSGIVHQFENNFFEENVQKHEDSFFKYFCLNGFCENEFNCY